MIRKICLPLMICVGLLLQSACFNEHYTISADLFYSSGLTCDTIAPEVVGISSLSCSEIQIVFSEDMNPSSVQDVSNYNIKGLPILLAVQDTESPNIVNLITESQDQQTYQLIISNVSDAAGTILENAVTLNIQTNCSDDPCPVVEQVNPIHNSLLSIQFSEIVDSTTALDENNYSIPGLTITDVISSSNPFFVNVYTSAQLAIPYQIEFGAIQDTTGNVLCGNTTANFSGTLITDSVPPYLTAVNAINNHMVELTFNEPMAKNTLLDISNYSILGLDVEGVFIKDDSNKVIRLLTSSQTTNSYTCSVSSSLTDIIGNALNLPNSGVFTGVGTAPVSFELVNGKALSPDTIEVFFSAILDETSANTAGNYSIPGLTILDASRDSSNPVRVVLTTSPQLFQSYTLTVNGLLNTLGTSIGSLNTLDFMGEITLCISSISAPNSTKLWITFNREVELPACNNSSNYIIDTGTYPPVSVSFAQRDSTDLRKVQLDTSPQNGFSYTMNVSNLLDTNGNPIGTTGACNSYAFTGNGTTDIDPPAIVSINRLTTHSFQIVFDENVELVTAETLANYQISPLLALNSVTRDSGDYRVVTIETAEMEFVTYTVTITNVADLVGNAILSPGINDTFLGEDAPKVSEVVALDENHVMIIFTEDVDQTSAETATNYSIPGLTVSTALRMTNELSTVILTTNNQVNGQLYTLTVSNVMDLIGTPVGTPNTGTFDGVTIPNPTLPTWIGGGSDGWKSTNGSTAGSAQSAFNSPTSLILNGGALYISEYSNHRLSKWLANGTSVGWIGVSHTTAFLGGSGTSSGTGDGEFNNCEGVDFDSLGNLYVVDASNARIHKWDSAMVYQGWVGKGHTSGFATGGTCSAGSGDGEMNYPEEILVLPDDSFLVTDSGNHRVQKWDSSGSYIGWIGKGHTAGWTAGGTGSSGTGDGEFNTPLGIWLTIDNELLVADFLNHRVQLWTLAGSYIGWIGKTHTSGFVSGGTASSGSGDGQFNRPAGLFVDTVGSIYVADFNNHRIQKWSKSGVYIGWIGGGHTSGFEAGGTAVSGNAPGQFNSCQMLRIDSTGTMYVVDTGNDRVLKY